MGTEKQDLRKATRSEPITLPITPWFLTWRRVFEREGLKRWEKP